MKNKLIIAALACVALGACQPKATEDKKETSTTTVVVPAPDSTQHNTAPAGQPGNPGHSMNEHEHTNLAAGETSATTTTTDSATTTQPSATTTNSSTTTTAPAAPCAEGDTKCMEDKAKADQNMNMPANSSTTTTTTPAQ
jgi:hypothetical protein